MKRLISFASLAVLFLTVSAIRADVPTPHRPGDAVYLNIVIDEKAAPAKLTVPKELVAAMKASLDNASDTAHASISAPTIAAGLSLSLALAFGGVWLVRNRTTPGMKNLMLLIGAFTLVGITGANVLGNGAPFKRPAPAPGELVVVTVVDREGAPITLTITKDKLAKAIENAPKPEPK